MLEIHETPTTLPVDSDIGGLGVALLGVFGAVTKRHLVADVPSRTIVLHTTNLYGTKHETVVSFDDVAAVIGRTDRNWAHVEISLRSGGQSIPAILVVRTPEQAKKAADVARKIAQGASVPCQLDDGFDKLLVWR